MNSPRLLAILVSVMVLSVFFAGSVSAAAEQGGLGKWLSKANSFLFGVGGSSGITGFQTADTSAGKVSPCPSYGDVDGDGLVSDADSDLISKYRVGTVQLSDSQLKWADVTADGQVTISDALIVSQFVAGSRATFAACSGSVSSCTASGSLITGSGTKTICSQDKISANGLSVRVVEISWALQGDTEPKVELQETFNAGICQLHVGEECTLYGGSVLSPSSNGLRFKVLSIQKNENSPKDSTASLQVTEVNPAIAVCTDSDGGFSLYEKGTATATKDSYSQSKTDYCDGVSVFEYYCRGSNNEVIDNGKSGTQIDGEYENCPNGCKDGACVKDAPQNVVCPARIEFSLDKSSYVAGDSINGKIATYDANGKLVGADLIMSYSASNGETSTSEFSTSPSGIYTSSGTVSSSTPVGTYVYTVKSKPDCANVVSASQTLKVVAKLNETPEDDSCPSGMSITTDKDSYFVGENGNIAIRTYDATDQLRGYDDVVVMVGPVMAIDETVGGSAIKPLQPIKASSGKLPVQEEENCPDVCIELWYVDNGRCVADSCVSGCSRPDGVNTFGSEEECKAKLVSSTSTVSYHTISTKPFGVYEDAGSVSSGIGSEPGTYAITARQPWGCDKSGMSVLSATKYVAILPEKLPPPVPQPGSSYTVNIEKGWNMVSLLPLLVVADEGGEGGGQGSTTCSWASDESSVEEYAKKNAFGYDALNQRYVRIGDIDSLDHSSRDGYLYNTWVNGFWLRSSEDCSFTMDLSSAPSDLLNVVGKISENGYKFAKGWNFFAIWPDMISKSVDDIKGSCDVKSVYAYDAGNRKWVAPSDFGSSEFGESSVGYGFVMKVANDCVLGYESVSPPPLPFSS